MDHGEAPAAAKERPINIHNPSAVRGVLENSVMDYLTEEDTEKGRKVLFYQDKKVMYIKILLCTIATACGVYAGYVTQLRPDLLLSHRPLIIAAVSTFVMILGALQLIATLVEKDYLCVLTPSKDSKAAGIRVNTVKVWTDLDRMKGEFVMKFLSADGETIAEASNSVGSFFSEDGFFEFEAFDAAVAKWVQSLKSVVGKKTN